MASTGRLPGWLVSWPMIALGLLLCVLPGLVLLWARPVTSPRVKAVVTALVAGVLLLGPLTDQHVPGPDAPAIESTAESATGTPSPPGVTASPSGETTPASPSTPSPTASSPSDAGGEAAAPGTALAAAETLPVRGRAPRTGYARQQFGAGWVDVDRNGCDTRNDLLRATLADTRMSGRCKVLAGALDDPYTGATIRFEFGGPSEVDVDHMVALGDAWQKGAQSWPFPKRVAFANDPLNLQPTDAGANRAKGDGDTATWLPPNKAYRCTYVARQVAVKAKYGLSVTAAEQQAMTRVLRGCPDLALPGPGPQPTIASNTGGAAPGAGAAKAPNKPTAAAGGQAGVDPRFSSCRTANAAGYGPYARDSDREYGWYQDRDGDGWVCER